MFKPAIAAIALTASACASAPGPADTMAYPTGDKDTCEAGKYAALIGKPITSPGVPASGPHIRHIGPNAAVTMDYSPQRLNFWFSADGLIEKLSCV